MKKLLLAATAMIPAMSLAAQAQEITVAAANVSSYLDPGRDHSNVGQQFYYNSFDSLLGKDVTTLDRVWLPGIATEWKLIEPTIMELKIRQGVKFHNGMEMTVDDVLFSLNRLFQATYPLYVPKKNERFANIDRAEKVDDETIRIHALREEPLWEPLLNLQQINIVPQAYVASLTGDPETVEDSDYEAFALAPVGTGPYKITEFVPGERVVYERFDDFWGEKAPVEKVTILHVPEASSRLTALRTGEAQIATNVAPDQLALLENDPNLKVEGAATALFHMMIMNQNHPDLKDPRIRQAMMLSIDRNLLNEALWLGKAIVPDSHTMEEHGDMYMPELKTFTFDPELAKQLLEEAGYDGSEISFWTQGSYYTNGLLVAQAITEMWKAVGINAVVKDMPQWNGPNPEMMAHNWSNPMYYTDPMGSFGTLWGPGGPSDGEGRFNVTEEYAEMFERFRYSPNIEDRKAAYAEIMDYLAEDPALIPLYRPYESFAMVKNVNWKPQPGNIAYVLDFRAGSISLED